MLAVDVAHPKHQTPAARTSPSAPLDKFLGPCPARPRSARPLARCSPSASRRRCSAAAPPEAARGDRRCRVDAVRPRHADAAQQGAGRRRCARCRCTRIWRRTRCPTTIRRSSRRGSGSSTRSVIDKSIGLGHHADAAAAARARHRRGASSCWEKILVWSHWVWFAFPHGTVAYVLIKHREQFPQRGGADLRDVRHRRDRLLGDPDRSAVVRGAAGPDGGRTHAGAAADDGRVRRAVLEAGLGAAVRCAGRQSTGRHAVAALRHLRDGRARAERHRPCRGRARLDLRGHARRRARVPGRALRHGPGRPGSRSPRASAWRRRWSSPQRPRLSRTLQQLEAKARYDQRAGADGGAPPARRRARRRRSRPGVHRPQRPDAVRLPGRDDPRRSTCCCRSSPAWRTRGAGSRTARRSGSCSRSCSRSACSGATSRCSAASSRRSPRA